MEVQMSDIYLAYEDDIIKYCMEKYDGDWYLHCDLKSKCKSAIIHSCAVFKHLSDECINRGVGKIYAYTPSIHFAELNGFKLLRRFEFEGKEWGHMLWQQG